MSKDELLALLHKLGEDTGDPEADHTMADTLLLEYINDPAVTRAFDDVHKWYA